MNTESTGSIPSAAVPDPRFEFARLKLLMDESHQSDREESRDNLPGEEAYEELVLVSLLVDHGLLGIAVFDAVTTRLQTIEVHVGHEASRLLDAVERVRTQFAPHKLLISSRNASMHGLMDVVKTSDTRLHSSISVAIRKHTDFNYLKACKTLEQVRVGRTSIEGINPASQSEAASRRLLHQHTRSIFNLESAQVIRATGALLSFIMTEKIGHQLDDLRYYYFAAVEQIALDGIMFIDQNSMKALQIFNQEPHPSIAKGVGRAKEGFSLFGLLNHTVTKAGEALLRKWMLEPLTSRNEIEERHLAVDFLISPDQTDLRTLLIERLRQFGDVGGIFRRVKQMRASAKDWLNFHESLNCFMILQTHARECFPDDQMDALPLFLDRMIGHHDMHHVINLLGNVIDFDGSKDSDEIIIRSGISDVLDSARTRYEDLDNILTEVAYQIQEKDPNVGSIALQYIPQIGYVVTSSSRKMPKYFEFQFQEDDFTFYFKDECCRELDSSIGDIYGFIGDIQRQLLAQLTVALLEHEGSIHEMTESIAQIDCVLSLAKCARDFNFVRPTMLEESDLFAKNVRHPLQEIVVNNYIPNDVRVGGIESIKVITGQNGSGKSVYLRMVGLIQYMAQIGSFVPATEARIGIVSKIFTRIQSFETAFVAQSSFTIDTCQVAYMLNHGDPRSLLLIDEFGKGTAEHDGIALLSAVLNHFSDLTKSLKGPRAVITTHLMEIIQKDLVPANSLTQQDRPNGVFFATMASMNPSNDQELVATPLFELKRGVSVVSNALGCALQSGLPEQHVRRAYEIMQLTAKGMAISVAEESTEKSCSPLKTLSDYFASVHDWNEVSSDDIRNFITLVQMNEIISRQQL